MLAHGIMEYSLSRELTAAHEARWKNLFTGEAWGNGIIAAGSWCPLFCMFGVLWVHALYLVSFGFNHPLSTLLCFGDSLISHVP